MTPSGFREPTDLRSSYTGLPRRGAFRAILSAMVMLSVVACGGDDAAPDGTEETPLADADWSRAQRLEALLSTLAADSMEGRRTGTAGAHRAAAFLAAELERYGIEAAGDEGSYLQTVPMARITDETDSGARERMVMEIDYEGWDDLPAESMIMTESNVIGIIRGSDPNVANEAIVVGAHFDHVGIGASVPDGAGTPDSIYNGADDDGYAEANLWTGVGRARSGAGAAIVGDPDQVVAKLKAYQEVGVEAFILSGYTHIAECDLVAEHVLPNIEHSALRPRWS